MLLLLMILWMLAWKLSCQQQCMAHHVSILKHFKMSCLLLSNLASQTYLLLSHVIRNVASLICPAESLNWNSLLWWMTFWRRKSCLEIGREACHMHTSCLSWTGSINLSHQLPLTRSSVSKFQIEIRTHCSPI